jgi:uncharacterized membrane protein
MQPPVANTPQSSQKPPPPTRHFRAAVVKGLAALFPPLLTVVIIVWVIGTTQQYVVEPVTKGAREGLVWLTADIRQDLPLANPAGRTAIVNGHSYYRLDDGSFVPTQVYDRVLQNAESEHFPRTGKDVYRRYVDLTYLRPYYAIPFFLLVFILFLYLLGKFMAAGIGSFFWGRFEGGIHRLPLVRSVYSATKQVTDFFFSEQQMKFTRVVAVEYPRTGMWSIAFVTSEGFQAVRSSIDEPLLGVFIPTSPMPMTGYALTVRKSEVVDLHMTIDEAIQFIVSCGLVVPGKDVKQPTSATAGLSSSAAHGEHTPSDPTAEK